MVVLEYQLHFSWNIVYCLYSSYKLGTVLLTKTYVGVSFVVQIVENLTSWRSYMWSKVRNA